MFFECLSNVVSYVLCLEKNGCKSANSLVLIKNINENFGLKVTKISFIAVLSNSITKNTRQAV